jgi:hypothetical protein
MGNRPVDTKTLELEWTVIAVCAATLAERELALKFERIG